MNAYQTLIDGYLHGMTGASEVVRLNCVVKEIAWKKGEVRVSAKSRAGFPLQTFHTTRAVAALQGWATHDWSQAPYSLGAYSYVGVDGVEGAARLTRPVADTLYFAGEATALDTTRGTVEGALQSGLRAAKQILKHSRA